MARRRNRRKQGSASRNASDTGQGGRLVELTAEGAAALESMGLDATAGAEGIEVKGADGKAATPSELVHVPQLMALSSQLVSPKRGTRELLLAYSASPWLRAVFSKIARTVAETDWQLFALKGSNGRFFRDDHLMSMTYEKQHSSILKAVEDGRGAQIFNHPILEMIRRGTGNARLNGFSCMQMTMAHYDLTGEAHWLLERNEIGTPVAYWPLPTHWIKSLPTPKHPAYRVNAPGGHELDIPVTEIIPFIDPDPHDPYRRGTGIAKSLDDEIEIDEYAAKHCHDEETECLTRNGWVKGVSLTYDDEIATWDEENGVIEYQKPDEVILSDYEGEMHHWTGRAVDVLVTPNHRFWVNRKGCFNRKTGKWYAGLKPEPWHFRTSAEIMRTPGKPYRWRATGFYSGENDVVQIPPVSRITKRTPNSRGGGRPPMFGVDEELVFDAARFATYLGYFISEGSIDRCASTICQTEGRYVDDMRRSLKVFNEEWIRESSEERSGKIRYRWFVRHLGLTEWLKKHVGEGAENKRLPIEVFEWPFDAKMNLLDALINGDGHRHENGKNMSYVSKSEQLIDDIQQLCLMVGWTTSKTHYYPHGRLIYVLSIRTSRQHRTFSRQNGTWGDPIHYVGKIWCVSVQNETFFSRRNGKVLLGGNSKAFFKNRARPDVIISGQFINKSDAERLERKWLSEHQGFWKAFKPLFFSQKIDVKELSQTFEQLQMVQVRKQERDTFISVVGAPPEKFGVIGESKRSTIQAADFFWAKDVIRPRIEMIVRTIQELLVPQFDDRLIFTYDTPVLQDDEFRLKIMKEAPYAFKINEWREEAGKESLGEPGEMFAIPSKLVLVPASDFGEEAPPEETPPEEDEENPPEEEPEEEAGNGKASAKILARRHNRNRSNEVPDADADTVARELANDDDFIDNVAQGIVDDLSAQIGKLAEPKDTRDGTPRLITR